MRKKDEYIRLIGFVRPHLGVFALAFLCALSYSVFNGISITGIIPIIDNILGDSKITLPQHRAVPVFIVNLVGMINSVPKARLVNLLLVGFVIYFFFRCLFDFMKTYFMNDLSQRVIRDIRGIIYEKLLDLSMKFYSHNPTGKLMSRITYDAAIIRDSISSGLLDLIQQPMEIMIYFAVALGVAATFAIPLKFLLTSAVLFPAILFPAIIIGRRLRKITTRSQEKISDINITLFETISGIRIVKAFCMEGYELEKFKQQNRQFYKLAMKSVKRNELISPLNEWTSVLYLGIVVYMAVKAGLLSWGPFITFGVLMMTLLRPIKRLSKLYVVNQQALSAATRIFEILDMTPDITEKKDAVKLGPIKNEIAFENVCFRYERDEVLKNITLSVRRGEIVAIVGPSGVGKSTLVNLIPRFYDTTGGRVLIDGVDTRDAAIKSLRDQIGIVTQEMLLFNDTVANNISYGSASKFLKEDVIKAARIANAHDFIEATPRGYNTVIGERGFRLSGGERQRIAIARAVFKNPPILILDEATSQLDTESEKLVQDALEHLMQGRTVFVIAHRLSTVRHADKIIVLDKGEVVDGGSHAELLERGGLYKKLYDMQFVDTQIMQI